jgi:hypothetical protein
MLARKPYEVKRDEHLLTSLLIRKDASMGDEKREEHAAAGADVRDDAVVRPVENKVEAISTSKGADVACGALRCMVCERRMRKWGKEERERESLSCELIASMGIIGKMDFAL